MKTIIFILLFVLTNSSSAEQSFNKPLLILLDENKNPIEGVTKSTDLLRCGFKAANLGEGTYYCHREDVRIDIVKDPLPNTAILTWTAPTENTDNSPLANLSRFKIYYGINPTELTTVITITDSALRQYEITDLVPNTYYFGVVAVNSMKVHSKISDIVSKVIN